MPTADVNVMFGDPPAALARTGRAPSTAWLEAAEQLRDNPGAWAQVTVKDKRVNATSAAHYIRSGIMRAFEPAGHFEAMAAPARNGEEGSWGVFVRYVGEKEVDPIEELVAKFNVKELQAQCKELGLPFSGSKRTLAERLIKQGTENGDNSWENE